MLYIVLILVLAALGLLVTALVTANSLWAWISIVLSVLAGVVLVADWIRRRRRARQAKEKAASASDVAEPAGSEAAETEGEATEAEASELPETKQVPAVAEVPEDTEPSGRHAQAEEQSAGDPAEEPTPPADAKAVAKLKIEVLVVDEYPRYHVAACSWLTGRETIPISVAEARDLGFTPCARCTPDAKLLAAPAK